MRSRLGARRPLAIIIAVVGVVSVLAPPATSDDRRGPATPPYTPVTMPERPTRLLLLGDSVAGGVAEALGAEAARRAMNLAAFARAGCGVTDGIPVGTNNPDTSAWCARDNDTFLTAAASTGAASAVDAVVVWSSWEINSHVVDGRPLEFRSAAWDAGMTRELDELHARFGRVPLLLGLTAPRAPVDGGIPTMTPEEAQDVRRYDEFLRAYAALRPGEVGVVRVDRILCPGGAVSCPEVIDGVVPRPHLGAHFDAAGAAWFAPRFLDAVQRTWEQIAAVATTPPGF